MKLFFVLLLFLTVGNTIKAQRIDWEPGLSYTWKSGPQWSYNIQFDSRSKLFEEKRDYEFLFYEVEFYATKKFFNENRITGGYLFRHREPFSEEQFSYEHRFLQQFTLISFLTDNRLAHRFRAEQRIKSDEYENRLRYRLSYDFPLKGQNLDPGEKYLILSNEVLSTFNAVNFEYANRIFVGLGWYLSSKRKFESGIETRIGDIGGSRDLRIQLVTEFFINR